MVTAIVNKFASMSRSCWCRKEPFTQSRTEEVGSVVIVVEGHSGVMNGKAATAQMCCNVANDFCESMVATKMQRQVMIRTERRW
jgi:hypothetical protein